MPWSSLSTELNSCGEEAFSCNGASMVGRKDGCSNSHILGPGCRDPSCEYEYSQKLHTQLNAKDWLQLSLEFEHIFCFNASLSKLICPSLVILPSGPHLTAFSLYSGYKPIDLSKSCARIKIEWGPQDSGWISWIACRYDFLYKDLQNFLIKFGRMITTSVTCFRIMTSQM